MAVSRAHLKPMFIQTEPTPNPDVLKFLPGRTVLAEGGREFLSMEEAERASPLAEALFSLEGVRGVYLGSDFVSVTRDASGPSWPQLKPALLAAIMDHFTGGLETVRAEQDTPAEPVYESQVAEIVTEIKALLDTRIRPAVAQDGGDILFEHFDAESGTLWLRMRGACAGCPSSGATLKAGVENMMRHYVPEVQRVEQSL